ncbi:MAG: PLDc N-terminal domain-containing protein, partial [Gemmataceae bacterium]|nr:PLDc N-terminal domain-containing protein [Gemmataceae bacterium]
MSFLSDLFELSWQDVAGWLFLLEVVLTAGTLIWVLHLKREPQAAIAWCLTVILMPFLGAALFALFGYQTIHRPLARKRKRRTAYRRLSDGAGEDGEASAAVPEPWGVLAGLARHPDGFPVTAGNRVTLYHHGGPAYDAMLEAVAAARHHVHLEFFIVRPDASGRRFLDALVAAARRGVEVRFVYDSVGSYSLSSRMVRELAAAGGKVVAFLPLLNPLYRLRVNLRNHRKILIVDGRVGFTGGLNIGDEYLGLAPQFGYWRDTHLRLEGPAVASLQRVFLEDWFFAAHEAVRGSTYYPEPAAVGDALVQIAHSGPDAEYKAIRETYFAGILRAR